MFKFITLLTLALSFNIAVVPAQDQLSEERVLLTFIPNVQFAPFYLAIEAGYFAQAGFEVQLEHLQEPEVLDLVAVGQANFGIVSGEQVILARSQSRDVVFVFEWFQQYPVGLVFSDEADYHTLENLRGKKVGIPGRFGASYSGLTSLLHSGGLTEADIEVNEIGFYAPEVFCLGAVDAAVVYVNNEPLQIRKLAGAGQCGAVEDVSVVTVASQVDLVSNGLIVSQSYLDAQPDSVRRMVAAFAGALQATINNPAAAYLASLNYVEGLPAADSLIEELTILAEQQAEFLASNPDRELVQAQRQQLMNNLQEKVDAEDLTQLQVLLNTIELWDADRLGFSDLASWEAMRDTLNRMGFLDDAITDLTPAFTNEFVPGNNE